VNTLRSSQACSCSVICSFDVLCDLDALLRTVSTLFVRRPKLFGLWEILARRHGVSAFVFPIFNKTPWFSRWQCVKRLMENYPVLVRFLYVVLNSSLNWDVAKPILNLLTDARTVVMLHAVADIVEPLESSRKLFETSGSKLSDLTAPLRVVTDRLRELKQANSIQDF
jgi:hypothetical protein